MQSKTNLAERAEFDPKQHCTTSQAAAWAGFTPHHFMYKVAPAFGLKRFYDRDKSRLFYDREQFSTILPKIKAALTENGTVRRGLLSKPAKKRRRRRKNVAGKQVVRSTTNGNGNGTTPIQVEVTAENIQKLMRAGVPIQFVMK